MTCGRTKASMKRLICRRPITLWRPSYTAASTVIVSFFCIAHLNIHVYYTYNSTGKRPVQGTQRHHEIEIVANEPQDKYLTEGRLCGRYLVWVDVMVLS